MNRGAASAGEPVAINHDRQSWPSLSNAGHTVVARRMIGVSPLITCHSCLPMVTIGDWRVKQGH